VAHSSFGRIGVDPEFERAFIEEQIHDLEQALAALAHATGEREPRNVKQITKRRDALRARLQELFDQGGKDVGLTFNDLGVDALVVDEAHEFKNLEYATSLGRVAGLGDPGGSKKASDLLIKIRSVQARTGGRNIIFATGTPVSNTIAEMYTIMRYLDHTTLKQQGLSHFDAWARVFANMSTELELTAAGSFKPTTRFRRFVNTPEMMQRYRSFADVIVNDDIKRMMEARGERFPLPKVKGGKPANVVVPRSAAQAAFIGVGRQMPDGRTVYDPGTLIHRSENLPKKFKPEKGDDNMLKIMSDARKAALDMRLVVAGQDQPGSKTHAASDNIKRLYDQWHAKKGTQLVFLDTSTPKKAQVAEQKRLKDTLDKAQAGDDAAKKTVEEWTPDDWDVLNGGTGFSVYDDMKDKLIQRGIPANEIAFIHDANTELQKEELFGKVRSGRIRVLFGSTAKMGAGTNVQDLIVALHHMDAPWRPSDLAQREGRAIRQGNKLYAEDPDGFEIEINRYATENTLDALQWQVIETKANFIDQMRRGGGKQREVEDVGAEVANAAEMKAAASGNPLIFEEMNLRNQLRRVENAAAEHRREQLGIRVSSDQLKRDVADIDAKRLPEAEKLAVQAAEAQKKFAVNVQGKTFTKPGEVGNAIKVAAADLVARKVDTPVVIGKWGDLHIYGRQAGRSDRADISLAHVWGPSFYVEVDDDATGIGVRLRNTPNKLVDRPAELAAERAAKAAEIPKLEAQFKPFDQADALEALRAQHQDVLAKLRPPPATGAAAAPAPETPETPEAELDERGRVIWRDTSPDNSNPTRYTDLGIDLQLEGDPKGDHAKAIILKRTRESVNADESQIAIDVNGDVISNGVGRGSKSGMTERIWTIMADPVEHIVFHHTHPKGFSFSDTDIAGAALPGVTAIYAHGMANRVSYRLALNPAARGFLQDGADIGWNGPAATALFTLTGRRLRTLYMPLERVIRAEIAAGRADKEIANRDDDHMRAVILEDAGWGQYDVYGRERTSPLLENPAIKAAYDEAVLAHRAAIEPWQRQRDGLRRPAEPVRHPGELAQFHRRDAGRTAERAAQPAAGRSAEESTFVPGPGEGIEEVDDRYLSPRREPPSRRTLTSMFRGKLTDLKPAMMATIPLNYFTELAPRQVRTETTDYLRDKRAMDAYRGKFHSEADQIVQAWRSTTRLGRKTVQELHDLMADATLAGTDPASLADEHVSHAEWEGLRKRFMKLPQRVRDLYIEVRDAYRAKADETDRLIIENLRDAIQIARRRADRQYLKDADRIRRSKLEPSEKLVELDRLRQRHSKDITKAEWSAKARISKLRKLFETNRVPEPYFPLGRFGQYYVEVRNAQGDVVSFSRREKKSLADQVKREMQGRYPASADYTVKSGKLASNESFRDRLPATFVGDVEAILEKAGVDQAVKDQIWQRYIETMPDLSMRKSAMHRRGVAGFERDALRVFASQMFHAGHQLGRLKFGQKLKEHIDKARDKVRDMSGDDEEGTRATILLDELGKRHDWVMNPGGSGTANYLSSLAFIWYLGLTPAAAMVNLSQTFMMGVPVLSGRFGGVAKATAALTAALPHVFGNKRLSADEKAAMEAFYESGLIDKSQSHDIAGVGETGLQFHPGWAKAMRVISALFHYAELANRRVTALAAYRMAKKAGQSHEQALDTAHDLTYKTHFDYSNTSRPRFLQNDFAKVAATFKAYQINMLYRIIRDFHQSIKGESPQAKAEARRQLVGVLGMQALLAGTAGVFGFNLAMAILTAIDAPDEDDPLDYDQKYRNWIMEMFGPNLGGVILNGVPGSYLGVDLTNRIGMPDLLFQVSDQDREGDEEFYYYLMQALGVVPDTMLKINRAINGWSESGDIRRAFEDASPKFIKDALKTWRMLDEGVNTRRGDPIVPADQIGADDAIKQALGFRPLDIAGAQDRQRSLIGAEQVLNRRRQNLINRYALAVMAEDDAAEEEALAAIDGFNDSRYGQEVPIKTKTLRRSIKKRESNLEKSEGGVLIESEGLSEVLREAIPAFE
jgi:conjugative element/phage-associated large polyvalent protein/helicase-like protein